MSDDSLALRVTALCVVLVGLLLVFGLVVAASPAAAQEGNASDESNESNTTVLADLDTDLRITDKQYDTEEQIMSVTIEHRAVNEDRTAQVTISEVVSPDNDGGRMGIEMAKIRPGETVTVEVAAQSFETNYGTTTKAEVMVLSELSIEEGYAERLTYTEDTGPTLFSAAASWGLVRLAGFGGSAGTVVLGGLIAWHKVAKRTNTVTQKL